MEKTSVSFWDFLFKIGDDYLMFLRNLTPAVLFFSLALFMFGKFDSSRIDFDEIVLLFFSFTSAFIAFSVMLINGVSFTKKVLKGLKELHHQTIDEEATGWALFQQIWQQSNAKQLLFFLSVNLAAILLVVIYGMKYAINFYSAIATMMN